MKTHKSDGRTEVPVSNQRPANQVDLEILSDSKKRSEQLLCGGFNKKKKKKMPGGETCVAG